MCFFEDNCPSLKERLDLNAGPTNVHHFFFPKNLFKHAVWQGKPARKVFFTSFVKNQELFHGFFAKNCAQEKNRNCKACDFQRACCHSATQPESVQQFVKKHCPESALMGLYRSAKPKEKQSKNQVDQALGQPDKRRKPTLAITHKTKPAKNQKLVSKSNKKFSKDQGQAYTRPYFNPQQASYCR